MPVSRRPTIGRYCPASAGSSAAFYAQFTSPGPAVGPARRRRGRRDGRPGGYSGAGPDDRDPQPVGGLLGGLVDDRGWQRPLAEARVFADWAGAGRSRHRRPLPARRVEPGRTADHGRVHCLGDPVAADGEHVAGLPARQLGPESGRQDHHHRADRAELEARRLVGARRRGPRIPTGDDWPTLVRLVRPQYRDAAVVIRFAADRAGAGSRPTGVPAPADGGRAGYGAFRAPETPPLS